METKESTDVSTKSDAAESVTEDNPSMFQIPHFDPSALEEAENDFHLRNRGRSREDKQDISLAYEALGQALRQNVFPGQTYRYRYAYFQKKGNS